MKSLYDYFSDILEEGKGQSIKWESYHLRKIEDDLLGLKEFKNTKNINFLDFSVVKKIKDVVTVEFNTDDEFYFNEVVDLYQIYTTPKRYSLNGYEIKSSVYTRPTIYESETFLPIMEINIRCHVEEMKDSSFDLKKEILKKVEEGLEGKEMEQYIGFTRKLIMCVSPRSIENV